MTSKQAAKGSAYERLIVDYLRASGFTVDRTRAGWADDRGDIHGINNVTIECKNHKALSLSTWVAELLVECRNAGTDYGVVVHKKRGVTDAADQYATLPFGMFVRLLREAGYK